MQSVGRSLDRGHPPSAAPAGPSRRHAAAIQVSSAHLASRLLFSAGDAHQRRPDQLPADRSRPVTQEWAAGHWRAALELPPLRSSRCPIPSWPRRTDRNRLKRESGNEQKEILKRRPTLHADKNTHGTEVSVYTAAGPDNMRRLQSAFFQFTWTGSAIVSRYLPASSSKRTSLANKWNYHSRRAPCATRLRRAFRFFCRQCQAMLMSEPSMFLASPCNDFWWPLYCDYSGKLQTNWTPPRIQVSLSEEVIKCDIATMYKRWTWKQVVLSVTKYSTNLLNIKKKLSQGHAHVLF